MSEPKQSDSVFWIEVDKIKPNPYQPRKEFDSRALEDLADSIRQYGVLQPLTVTRHEEQNEEGLQVHYELIAGERRLRASKLAGLTHVPAIIRSGEETDKMKLELAIIENLQREDLNPIERAHAFKKLTEDFGLTHAEVGKRMGKSREYVSNALRLLQLPEYIQEAVRAGKITEGHARPLMMLRDQPDERDTLFKEILFKKMSVRDAEKVARGVAKDKVRKTNHDFDPKLNEYEKKFTENLGTRVSIEKRQKGDGGRIVIDYFSPKDLEAILEMLQADEKKDKTAMMDRYIKEKHGPDADPVPEKNTEESKKEQEVSTELPKEAPASLDDVIQADASPDKTTETTTEALKDNTEDTPPLQKEASASLDAVFGEDSPLAFDATETGVEDPAALHHDFEDDEEDDDDMDEYFANLIFGNTAASASQHKEDNSNAPDVSKEAEQEDTSMTELGNTLSALDQETSHDIKEEID